MSTKKTFIFLTIFLAISVALGSLGPLSTLIGDAGACTSVPVGKNASVDGSVMTTHTCDGWYDPRIIIVPGQTFKAGTMVPVYQNLCYATTVSYRGASKEIKKVGEIPQVENTYTYFHTGYPFMNEKQVMMGETTIGGRKELQNPDAWMMIEQLQVFALQRAKTARQAIKVMGALAEKYGYGDGGECLTVADPNEVWHFEIFGPTPLWSPSSGKPGAVWAAQRIPDGEVGVSANRSRIGEINLKNPDYFMASPNIFSLGEEMGWYDSKSGKPFLFHDVYGPKDLQYNRRREWRVLSLVAPSLKLDPWAKRYPFSVKPDKKISVQDLMAIKRDHMVGTEFDLTKGMAAGPFGNPNRYPTPDKSNPPGSSGWERAISMFRCSYSFVSQSRSWLPDPIGGVLWFGEDAPHSTVYIPLYCGITKVPESFTVRKLDVFDRNSAWWAFSFVSNWADLKFSYIMKDINAAQKDLEGDFLAMQPTIESAALDLHKKNPSLGIKYLTNYSYDSANRTVEYWWALGDKLIARYQDGYVDGKTVGYPEEWLKTVGFGLTAVDKQ